MQRRSSLYEQVLRAHSPEKARSDEVLAILARILESGKVVALTLYLLDKNVVENIRGSLKGTRSPQIRLAREIDRKGSTVSPLLAIVEGSARRPQLASEVHDCLVRDTHAVGMFYRQARTDAKALQDLSTEMIVTFGAHFREKSSALMPLAKALQALLARTFSLVDARDVLKRIDELARTHAQQRAHPLISCAVACLYGHTGARNVIKPTHNPLDGDAYNAVADIRMLMETAYLRRIWQAARPWEKVLLHSGDMNLNKFGKVLNVVAQGAANLNFVDEEAVSFSSTISEALLPNLATHPKEFERILAYLRDTR